MLEQKIDLNQARPARTAPVDAAAASQGLARFVAAWQATRQRLRVAAPAAPAANSVTVSPGGASFATIGAALASITDASQQKQYLVSVGPGTYAEVVTCRPWVFLQGAGTDQTVVTAPAGDYAGKGTVHGASNSAVQNMTIQSVGSGWGCWAVAVNVQSASNFSIENCALLAVDQVGGANMVALAVDYGGGASGSQVYVAYTSVLSNCVANQSQPLALLAFASSFVQATESKLVAQGGNSGWGGASNGGSNLTVDDCYVEGAGFSLNIPDYSSTCVANSCELVGRSRTAWWSTARVSAGQPAAHRSRARPRAGGGRRAPG